MRGILGRKVGMTQLFDKSGAVVPVTIIEAGPCYVTQVKTAETDGYNAVQIGYEEVVERKLTKGQRGISLEYPDSNALAAVRVEEQKKAAAILGVHKIVFFDYQDGYLVPDLEIRRAVTRLIRSVRPDIVVSCDPHNYFGSETYLNHPDHPAAGQIVVDAVFPAVSNPSFFPELIDEGFPATRVSELWLSLPSQANVVLDVTEPVSYTHLTLPTIYSV